MNVQVEILMAFFLLSCLMLAACSRMLHCIRIVALQGLLLGLMPLAAAEHIHMHQIGAAFLNISLKAVLLPLLLKAAMHKAQVKRELEPLVGYAASLLIVLGGMFISFWLGRKLNLPENAGALRLAVPVAFSVVLTGLFIIMARKKAITQVIGFLTFENGIALFGSAMMIECGLAVELGILLDVFVLVFIMGIAVMRINSAFEHIDSDKLNLLEEQTHGAAK
ncbi:MAG: hydrogenase [Lentisphaeria bacterium]|nr:hydrogenase [Lentisphaeria bacterium]